MIPALTGILAPHGLATSFESIATVTVGAGGSSTLSFSSISSTYTHLQIRVFGLVSAGGNLGVRFNGDTGNNYIGGHQIQGDGSGVQVFSSTTSTYAWLLGLYNTGYPGASVIDILDANSSSKYKTVRSLSGQDGNGSGTATNWRVGLHSGAWMSTSAITSIDIVNLSWSQYSTAALFGVKA